MTSANENFLQQFHNLADADTTVRCRAAFAIKDSLVNAKVQPEELGYTLRRLVRGVQSSRQCCRQGFSLALAEVIDAFPSELQTVLKLLDQTTELQTGLKVGEQKERLLGRLLVYAAIVQGGGLRAKANVKPKSKDQRGPPSAELLRSMGFGLCQVYNARPYVRSAATCLLGDICAELCAGDFFASVPEVLSAWNLDSKLPGEDNAEQPDANVFGLVLSLRIAYEDALQADPNSAAFKSWPACIRKDIVASNKTLLASAIKSLAMALTSNALGDAIPFMLSAFCRWWLKASAGRDPVALQTSIWQGLDEGLFPEDASMSSIALALKSFADLAEQLRDALGNDSQAEQIFAGFFQHMPKGLTTLLNISARPKTPAHLAAIHSQLRLISAVSGVRTQLNQQGGQQKNQNKRKRGSQPTPQAGRLDDVQWKPLSDDTRLLILTSLQRHQAFSGIPGNLQRQWQQALLSPLSPPGIWSRCSTIFDGLQVGPDQLPMVLRANAAQLEQLAVHLRAPDDVILAVLCCLFSAAFFAQAESASGSCGYFLRPFKSSVGLPESPEVRGDLFIPTLKLEDSDEESRKPWNAKFWSALSNLMRRTSHEAAEKLSSADKGASADEDNGFSSAGEDAHSSVRTRAYQGCLGDGSLLVLRLHDWWDYITKETPVAQASASPRISPKKRKRAEGGSALRCVVEVEDTYLTLRTKAVGVCRGILQLPEDGILSARLKNAICSLPLTLALHLLASSDEDHSKATAEPLSDVLEILEKFSSCQAGTKRSKLQRQYADILKPLPTVAAELFVNEANSMIREAAKTAWRELGLYISDETLTSLCASVKDDDEKPEGDEDEEDEEDDEEDGPVTAAQAARIAAFEQATKEGKARQAALAASGKKQKGDEDDEEEDVTTLDNDGVLGQLLEGDEGGASLLESFANSGLEGAPTPQKKLTKRQQQLRVKQDDVNRKFQEVELLESFLARYGHKRPVSLQLVQDLFEAMMKSSASAREGGKGADGEDGNGQKGGKNRKQTKADISLRHMEVAFSQRLNKFLPKVFKQLCRNVVLVEVSSWHTADEWATYARALCTMALTHKMTSAGFRSAEVGGSFLYFYCSAHRAVLFEQDVGKMTGSGGWSLAEELLETILREWGSKKDCDVWCQASLKAFAVRIPHVVRRLNWTGHIRNCKKAYAQRMQLSFVSNELLRPAQGVGEAAIEGPSPAFVDSFAELCNELLKMASDTSEADNSSVSTSSQKKKLKKDALQALKLATRAKHKAAKRKST